MTGWVLTDIEGTTSPIQFVRQTLFPYARAALPAFVAEHGRRPDVRHWLEQARQDCPGADGDEALVTCLQAWIDEDRKHTALKALQGLIWAQGYQAGDFRAPVYADVAPALRRWKQAGWRLAVYSSGSVQAQKLFFRHSDQGDLSALFDAWFDTTSGAKQDPAAYRNILATLGMQAQPEQVLFLSDVCAELDAAAACGMATCLLLREDASPPPGCRHRQARDFDSLELP